VFRARSFATLEWVSVLFLLHTLPRAPLILKYMMEDSNEEEEVVAGGLFCGFQVGHLLGMYKTWVR